MCKGNWKFSKDLIKSDRLAYLSRDIDFDEIINCINTEMKVRDFYVDDEPISEELKGCKRPIFKILVEEKTSDLFFNSPCGYRGKYFTDPSLGVESNKRLIERAAVKLIGKVKNILHGNNITEAELEVSLLSNSAKIWIDEDCCDFSISLIEEILNPRWKKYAEGALPSVKNNPNVYEVRAIWGLRAPECNTLDIKGAWINENNKEIIPSSKINRAEEINKYGFS